MTLMAVLNHDNEVVEVPDYRLGEYLVSGSYFDLKDIFQTEILIGQTVSTVFLGGMVSKSSDQNLFFETAIVTDESTMIERRYATYDQAIAGHIEIVDMLLEQTLKFLPQRLCPLPIRR